MRKSFAEQTEVPDCGAMPGKFNSARNTFTFDTVANWTVVVRVLRDGRPVRITARMLDNSRDQGDYCATITTSDGEPTTVAAGKNVGRANETNIFCQAMREAYGLWERRARRHSREHPLPMLARVFDDNATYPEPLFVQRKYNGIRAVATLAPGPVIYGRHGIHFAGFARICAEVARIEAAWFRGAFGAASTSPLYLDGELYSHGMSLQAISGITRRANDTASQDGLNFMLYDVFTFGDAVFDRAPFSERLKVCAQIDSALVAVSGGDANSESAIRVAPTIIARRSQIRELFAQFLREGYEGAIIRLDAPYEFSYGDYHSPNLLKLKPHHDAEFEIVDWAVAERGRAAGALLFICATATGERFTVTPTGSIEMRKRLAREFEHTFARDWRGKKITVIFDEISERGVPLRARIDCSQGCAPRVD